MTPPRPQWEAAVMVTSRQRPKPRKSPPRTPARRAVPSRSRPMTAAQQQWLVGCLLRDIPVETLRRELREAGVALATTDAYVASLAQDPAYQAALAYRKDVRKLEWRADIRRALDALGDPLREGIPRHTMLTQQELVDRHVRTNLPVILTGVVPRWPALRRWSPDYFRQVLGDIPVEIAGDRNSMEFYDLAVKHLSRTVPMREFVDWVEKVGHSNERYMVANNNNLGRKELAVLRSDVEPYPDFLDPTQLDGFVYLWFGPAGTLTRWHHDTTNILFSQVVGRKRISLIHPLEYRLLHHTNAYYATVDPVAAFPDIRVHSVELQPGESLLIPVAWWHNVEALDVSVSVSMTNFRFPNDYEAGNPYA